MDIILHIPISLGKRNEKKKVFNVRRTTNGKVIGMSIPVIPLELISMHMTCITDPILVL